MKPIVAVIAPGAMGAAVGKRLAVIGVEADRLVEIGKRLLGLSGLRQHRAAHVVGLRIVGIVLDGFGERSDVA